MVVHRPVIFPYISLLRLVRAGSDFCCASDMICQSFPFVVLTRLPFPMRTVAILALFAGRFLSSSSSSSWTEAGDFSRAAEAPPPLADILTVLRLSCFFLYLRFTTCLTQRASHEMCADLFNTERLVRLVYQIVYQIH